MAPMEKAVFLRTVERNGKLHGLVEAKMQGEEQPVLVLLERSPEGNYRLDSAYSKEADPEIDWYDNSLHQAYENISDLYRPSSAFVGDLLETGTVREDLERHLDEDVPGTEGL